MINTWRLRGDLNLVGVVERELLARRPPYWGTAENKPIDQHDFVGSCRLPVYAAERPVSGVRRSCLAEQSITGKHGGLPDVPLLVDFTAHTDYALSARLTSQRLIAQAHDVLGLPRSVLSEGKTAGEYDYHHQ